MAYNGSGVFSLYSPGNPVVTGTTISSTWANNTLSDIATGLSTCVLKDGTQTTTVRVPFAAGINSTLVTDATSSTTGSIITAGGISAQKAMWAGTTLTVAGATTIGGLLTANGVVAANFGVRSANSSQGAQGSGVWSTIKSTWSTNETWWFSAYVTNGGVAVMGTVMTIWDGTNLAIFNKSVGANFDFQVSGTALQVKQSSGGALTILWTSMLLAP
jgi:hypothetical protein